MSVTYSSRKLSIDQFEDFVVKVAKQQRFKSSIGTHYERLEVAMPGYSLPTGYEVSARCHYFVAKHSVSSQVFCDRLWNLVYLPWVRSVDGFFAVTLPRAGSKPLTYQIHLFSDPSSPSDGARFVHVSDVSTKREIDFYRWELDTLGFSDRYRVSIVNNGVIAIAFEEGPELNGITYMCTEGAERPQGLSEPVCLIRPMENAKASFLKLLNSEAAVSSTEIHIMFQEDRYAEDYPLAQALGLGPLRLEFKGKPNYTHATIAEAARRGDKLSLELCRFKPKDGLTVAVRAYKDAGDAPVRLKFEFRGEPEAYNRTMSALTELLGYEPILDDDVDGDPLEAEEGEE